jgi:hypothetical protein
MAVMLLTRPDRSAVNEMGNEPRHAGDDRSRRIVAEHQPTVSARTIDLYMPDGAGFASSARSVVEHMLIGGLVAIPSAAVVPVIVLWTEVKCSERRLPRAWYRGTPA